MKKKKDKMPWSENRISSRVDVRIPVSFCFTGTIEQNAHFTQDAFLHGNAENISIGGICFCIDIFVPEGTEIVVHIKARPFYPERQELNDYIKTKAKVVYSNLVVEHQHAAEGEEAGDYTPKKYRIGAEFVKIDPDDIEAINRFVNEEEGGETEKS